MADRDDLSDRQLVVDLEGLKEKTEFGIEACSLHIRLGFTLLSRLSMELPWMYHEWKEWMESCEEKKRLEALLEIIEDLIRRLNMDRKRPMKKQQCENGKCQNVFRHEFIQIGMDLFCINCSERYILKLHKKIKGLTEQIRRLNALREEFPPPTSMQGNNNG